MARARIIATADGRPCLTAEGRALTAEPGSPLDRVPVTLRGMLRRMDPVSAYALGVAHGRTEATRERLS